MKVTLGALLWLMLMPGAAWAQTGSIAGAVRDTTGAVLPGVTVEAASPALIEKIRTAVTDGQGRYSIADLRLGVYSVTFKLPGFNAVRREGLALSAGETMNVPAELAIGSVEETVTVSGQAPLVDVQNVNQHNVMTRDMIENLPTSMSAAGMVSLIPGTSNSSASQRDTGGTSANRVVPIVFSIHGSRSAEMPMFFDGLKPSMVNREGGGTSNMWQVNPGMVEQIVMDVGGHGVEAQTSGVRVNIIPKDGGNSFKGDFVADFTNSALQATNITPELQERGVRTTPGNEKTDISRHCRNVVGATTGDGGHDALRCGHVGIQ